MNLEARITRLESTRQHHPNPAASLTDERKAELNAIAADFDNPDGVLSLEGEATIADLRAFIRETAGAWR